MFTLTQIAQVIGCIIFSVGFLILMSGIIGLIATRKAQKVQGEIVGITQEYSARGFICKAKVEYVLNGVTKFYITKARTFKRGSGTVALYINKRGKVMEKGNMIWDILLGLGIIGISIAVFVMTR